MASLNLQIRTKGPRLMGLASASRFFVAHPPATSGYALLGIEGLLVAASIHLAAESLTSMTAKSPTNLLGIEKVHARTVGQQSLFVMFKNQFDIARTLYLRYQVQQNTALASKILPPDSISFCHDFLMTDALRP